MIKIKKIINWSFGAFFRTIGRVFAYLCIGILILIIGSILGSKLPLNRFIKVNAEELVVPVNFIREEHHNIDYTNSPGFEQSTANSLIALRPIYSSPDNIVKEYHITFDTQNKDYTNISYIEIPFTFSQPLGIVEVKEDKDNLTLSDKNSVYCKEWKQVSNGNYECVIFQNKITNTTITDHEYIYKQIALNQFSFYIQMVYSDDTWNTCSVNSSSNIVCNPNGKVPKQLYFYINFKTTQTTNFLLGVSRAFRLYSSATQEQINSINNIKDSTNDIKDSINNDNVDDATSNASGLFNNFENTDFGLTGIITAPLNLIKSMSSATCKPMKFSTDTGPFKNVEFSLPCLRDKYEEYFGSAFALYQMITFGIIAYKICVDLLGWVRSFRNPNEDRIEVVNL